jgi:hypothetical protein
MAVAPGGGVQQVRLYPVHGGAARTWSGTGGTIGVPFATRSLSWATSQHTLAFNWSAGQTDSVRLLDLGDARSSLLAASRPAVTLAHSANMGQTLYECGFMIITANESAVVCASGEIIKIARNGVITYTTGFPEFSAATGRLTRIVGDWPINQQHEPASVIEVLWSDASGRVLIGVIHSAGRYWAGVISGNKFTPLNVGRDPAADFGTW